jgi:signal transduction histidine kinase/AraC-like DNA-binding protein
LEHPLLSSVQGLDQAAVMAADYIAGRLTGRAASKGVILMVGATDDRAPTTRLRVHGFSDRIAQFSGLSVLRVGDGWRYDLAFQQLLDKADDWVTRIGDSVDAIFGLSDSLALAGRDACRRLGIIDEATVIVGINGDPLAIAAIEARTMNATVETSPQNLGFNLAEFAHRAACGESIPPHFSYTFELVTSHNVSQVAARKLVFIADLPSRLVDVNRRLEEQRLTQMEASLELNHRVGSILDQDELLVTMSEIIRTHYAYDQVHLYLWSNIDRTLTCVNHPDAQGAPEILPLNAGSPLGDALLHNQAINIPDTTNSQRYPPDPRWPKIRARVILPVHVGGRTLGVLDLHSFQRTLRSQVELDALQTLADELGTAVRNAQLYAQALQARVEAVQANLVKSRLLANVSHQLRSPLNVILGYCQAALSTPNPYGTPLPAELLHDLHYIERSGVDLQRLINDLLDLAQAETGTLRLHPETIDLNSLLNDVFEMCERTVGEHEKVRWKLHAPAQLPEIRVDPLRLRNILTNLLSNAANVTQRGQIVLGAESLEDKVHLWVQDTGPGIATEPTAQMRQSELRVAGALAPTESQHGLGLSVAHHLVQLHGGKLLIESEPGRGTTSHIYLPLPSPSAIMANAAPGAQVPTSQQKGQNRHSQQLVSKIRLYIEKHYAVQFTREQLAAELGVTAAYISRVFRQQTGISLWDFVNAYRIARARELLEHSELTITEIAFTVGFNDPAYFSRVFRKETGISPLAYRTTV